MLKLIRPTFIVGNWKMYKTVVEARAYVAGLALSVQNYHFRVGLAVPFTMIAPAVEASRGSLISIGAQNVNEHKEGAFTGEVSCNMLEDVGASFVIIGHSERRLLYNENDERINRKAKSAVAEGLRIILCVGETLEQRQKGQTYQVIQEQLTNGLKDFKAEHFGHVILAYEPIWAIGTHLTATPEIAQQVHQFCREFVARLWGATVAEHIIIQYGGSVKPDNAAALLDQPDIDGLLVGGASLLLDSFNKIIQCQRI